jgi:hypothetical protein
MTQGPPRRGAETAPYPAESTGIHWLTVDGRRGALPRMLSGLPFYVPQIEPVFLRMKQAKEQTARL